VDGLSLLAEARLAGLSVAAEGDRLVIRGPRKAEVVALRLIDHKGEVLAGLRRVPAGDTSLPGPIDPGLIWVNPSSYAPAEPVLDPARHRWRSEVAGWPHERWVRWRRLSTELLGRVTSTPTPEQIAIADHLAYVEARSEVESHAPVSALIGES
jgi:hypothetical protein